MDHIGTLLPKVLRKRGLHKHAVASLIVYEAQAWIQNRLSEHADSLHVHRFRDGTLLIRSADSVASQECQQLALVLLDELRSKHEGTPIDSLRIVRI